MAIEWLYRAVRGNILRGRAFELQRMVTERRADCLGYARLFHLLGQTLGLDIGIAEVVIDNAGRYVPHFVNVLRLSDGDVRFVDAWYGSTNILHRRMGLQVMHNGAWHTTDLDSSELTYAAPLKGIPSRCVYATVLFAVGNRHLENGLRGRDGSELDRALNYYNTAIALYPENPRFYFNRAIALENQGMKDEAGSDYRMALTDEDRLARVLARQHDEVLGLIKLDDKGISPSHQETYLLHKGFITGVSTPFDDIALRTGLGVERVKEIVGQVDAALSSS